MASVDCGTYNVDINESWDDLDKFITSKAYTKVGVLVDENTEKFCLPELMEKLHSDDFYIIRIKSGERNKTLDTCQKIWKQMLNSGFDRHSLLLNLGGGVIGDMGGFSACCFMRGLDFLQIPTTLLSQVDASVGGKLGVDFHDFKNIIGTIQDPVKVWIQTAFLDTLRPRELRSGYAEIIKHALIKDQNMWDEISKIKALGDLDWPTIIERSVIIKKEVVSEDKFEKGNRKILNFGHTLGHAIESENLHRVDHLLHGEAIGIGMIMEAYISTKLLDLEASEYQHIKKYILQIYPHYKANLTHREQILGKLIKDKKNRLGKLNFSLLNGIGECVFDVVPDEELIIEAFEDYINL